MRRLSPIILVAAVLSAQTAAADDLWPLPPGAVARVGSTRLRHGHTNLDLSFSLDGKLLASLDFDGSVCIWDAASGQVQRHFPIDGEFNLEYGWGIRQIWLTEGGKRLVIGGEKIFGCVDVASGRKLTTDAVPSTNIQFVTVSRDRKTAAAGALDGSIQIIELETGHQTAHIDPPKSAKPERFYAAFSRDAKTLYVADAGERAITEFDVASGTAKSTISYKGAILDSFAVSHDGSKIAIAAHYYVLESKPYFVAIQTLGDGKGWRTVRPKSHEPIVEFSEDDRYLVSCDADSLESFDLVRERRVRHETLNFWSHSLSLSGSVAALGVGAGQIGVVDFLSGKWKLGTGRISGPVMDLRFRNENRELLIDADTRSIWDWKRNEAIERHWNVGVLSPDLSVRAIRVGGAVIAQNAESGRIISVFWTGEPDYFERDLIFSADSRTLFTNHRDIRAWDVATGKRKYSIQSSEDVPNWPVAAGGVVGMIRCRFVPGADSEVDEYYSQFWDIKTGRPLNLPSPALPVESDRLMLSPDGTKAAACVIGQGCKPPISRNVVVWDVHSGRQVRSLPIESASPDSLLFSPDGRSLVSAGRVAIKVAKSDDNPDGEAFRNEIWLWEVATGKKRRIFDGHSSTITVLAYSTDGRFLATASQDAAIFVWDVYGLLPSETRLAHASSDQLWQELGNDSTRSFEAIRALVARSDQALPLFRTKLKPDASPDKAKVDRWIKDLVDERFPIRENASRRLAALGDSVLSKLLAAVAGAKSAEQSHRLHALIEQLSEISPNELPRLRAIEVLEHIGNADAKALLAELAKGEPGTRFTREVCETLKRLGKK
jgi:WD40 repeat protein